MKLEEFGIYFMATGYKVRVNEDQKVLDIALEYSKKYMPTISSIFIFYKHGIPWLEVYPGHLSATTNVQHRFAMPSVSIIAPFTRWTNTDQDLTIKRAYQNYLDFRG